MKPFARLLVRLCMPVLLFGLVACTGNPVPPAATEGETAETTAPVTGPLTEPATDPSTDTPSVTETETETGTENPGSSYEPVAFYDASDIKQLKPARMTCRVETDAAEGKYLSCVPRGEDPWIILSKTTDTAVIDARFMRIRYRTSARIAGRLYLGETQISEVGSMPIAYIPDGEWHTLELDLCQSAAYSPTLAGLRYDPMDGQNTDTEWLDIAWIAFYPDNTEDPTGELPPLPEDAPNLSKYNQTPDGSVYYRASGQLSGDMGTYTFKEGFELHLYRRGYFNRYTLGYSSTSPLKGEITYLVWNEQGQSATRTEKFFLEAGENMSFSSLTDDYFRNRYAYGVDGITLATCDGSTATFTLHSVTDSIKEIYHSTHYLENDRYKLGVLLTWGGGISYIEDKQDGDSSLGNLINRADPGRLIQQSYYGVNDGPHYTGAYYGNTLWGYNPVQGGDQYGNGSKLVDVQISPDGTSMYIKCRPMDWAHNNSPTPSYMENTYILEKDRIRVQNRFVDFMGAPHHARHAELPAFYTISHLGIFHYYNGNKPWTGDSYITLPNEPFWAGNGDAYHNIVRGNTETWAAFTNTAGYGIGLYVPGTEIMLAGRYEYNGSKDPANGGTSYVAPLRTMAIVSYVPFEYEYIIAAGTVDEMRATFKDYRDSN